MNDPGPTENASSLGVIILGAGASSRMGKPKLLLPWNGCSVVGHIISQWQNLEAAQIVMVCRPADELLFGELDRLSFPRGNRVINPHPERGMFSSVQCAANWDGWQPELSGWAVVLGDQPQLRPETLRTLLAFHSQHPHDCCQPSYEDRGGHPVLLSRSAFAQLNNTAAGTLNVFLKRIDGSMVKCPVDDPGLPLDLDTPEDYNRLTLNQPVNETRCI